MQIWIKINYQNLLKTISVFLKTAWMLLVFFFIFYSAPQASACWPFCDETPPPNPEEFTWTIWWQDAQNLNVNVTNPSIYFQWSPSWDPESGTAGYQLVLQRVDNGEWILDIYQNSRSYTYPATWLLNATSYEYWIRVQNGDGYWSDYKSGGVFTIDTTIPAGSITTPTTNTYYLNSTIPNISASVSDDNSGVNYTELLVCEWTEAIGYRYWTGITWATGCEFWNGLHKIGNSWTETSLTPWDYVSGREYRVYARVYDIAGNYNDIANPIFYYPDYDAPTVPDPTTGWNYSRYTTISFFSEPEDSGSGIAECYAEIGDDSGTVMNWTAVGVDGDYDFTGGVHNHNYYYRYYCTDVLGNQSAVSAWSSAVLVDTVVPTVTTPTDDWLYSDSSINFYGTSSDGWSGVSYCRAEIKLNNSYGYLVGNIYFGSNADFTFTGTHHLYLYVSRYLCVDRAGNQSAWSQWSDGIRVDSISPIIWTPTDNWIYTTTGEVIFTGNPYDAPSGLAECYAQIDIGNTDGIDLYLTETAIGTDGDYSFIGDLNETYYYRYYCKDNVNNQSTWSDWTDGITVIEATIPDIIWIDAGASSANRTALNSGDWFNDSDTGNDAQISFTWTDPASFLDESFYYIYNQSEINTINENGLIGWWNFDVGTGSTVNDLSGNGNIGILQAGTTFTDGQLGNAVSLNGINDNMIIVHNSVLKPTNEISISLWLKPETDSLNAIREIYRKEDGNDRHLLSFQDIAHCNDWGGTAGCLALGLSIGGSYTEWDVNIDTDDWENQWSHLVVSYDGSSRKMYQNGVLIATDPISGLIGASGTSNVYIGSYGNAEFFKGIIDEVKVYNQALSETEIAIQFNLRKTENAYLDNFEVNEGISYLHVKALNNAAIWGEEKKFNIKYDSSLSNWTFSTPTANTYYSVATMPDISANVSDGISGVDYTELLICEQTATTGYRYWTGSTWLAGCEWWNWIHKTGTSWTETSILATDYLAGREYRIYSRVYDNAGNSNVITNPLYYYLNYVWQNVPLPTTEWAYSQDVTVSFYASPEDSLSNIAECYAQVDVGNADGVDLALAETAVGVDGDYTFTGTDGETYYYRYYCKDNANTQTAWSAWTNGITVDTQAPVFVSKTSFATHNNNTNQISTFVFSDAVSGIASGNNPTCTISLEWTHVTCNVNVNVCDQAGNCNTGNYVSEGIYLDKTAPVISNPHSDPGSWPIEFVKDEVPYFASATENVSNEIVCEGRVDRDKISTWDWSGVVPFEYYDWEEGPPVIFNFVDNSMPLGTYYYQFRCKDYIENWSDWSAWTDGVIFENVAPEVTFLNFYSTDGVTALINWSMVDNGGSWLLGHYYKCSEGNEYTFIEYEEWDQQLSSSFDLECSVNGLQTATVYGVDQAWNTSEVMNVDYFADPLLNRIAPPPTDEGDYSASLSLEFYGTPTAPDGEEIDSCYAQVSEDNTSNIVMDWTEIGVDGDLTFEGITGNTYYYRYQCSLVEWPDSSWSTWSGSSAWSDGITIDSEAPDIVSIDAGATSVDRTSLTSDTWFNAGSIGNDNQASFFWTDPVSPSDDSFYYVVNETAWTVLDENDLIGWWSFDEGTGSTVTDLSGNGNDGTLNNGVAFNSNGQLGNALSFDGVNDSVMISHNSILKPTDEITLSAWVKPETGGLNAMREVYRKEDGNDRHLLSFQYAQYCSNGTGTAGCLAFGLNTGGSYSELDIAIDAVDWENQWSLITATYDGSSRKIYKDGVLIGSDSKSGAIGTTGTANAYIGAANGGSELFKGLIDEVKLYDTALSESEISTQVNLLKTELAYVDDIALTEGTSYMHIRPFNGVGTWGSEKTFTIKYDITLPTIPAPTDSGLYSKNTSLEFIANPSDSLSGLDDCFAQVGDAVGTVMDWTAVGADGDYTFTEWVNEGVYYYRYYCKDIAGNTSALSAWSDGITVDLVAPSYSDITVNNVSKTIGETVRFYIVTDDDWSGLDHAYFYLGTYPYVNWNKVSEFDLTAENSCAGTDNPVVGCDSGKFYYYYDWVIDEGAGTQLSVYARIYDSAGNVRDHASERYNPMDDWSISGCGVGQYNNGTNCVDTTAGYYSVASSDANLECTAGYSCAGGANRIICGDGFSSSAGSSVCTAWNVNTPSDTGEYASDVSLIFSATPNDAGAGIAECYAQIDVNNSDGSELAMAETFVGVDGGHTFTATNSNTYYYRYFCEDGVGNASNWSAWSDGITVDISTPMLSANNADTGTWFTSNQSIVVSVLDVISGLNKITYAWDSTADENSTETSNASVINIISEGIHQLSLWAKDNVGNISIWEGEYKLDTIASSWGAITYADGEQTNQNIAITINRGSDASSDLSTQNTDYLLEYKEANFVNFICGTMSEWQDAWVNEIATATNYIYTGEYNKCYQFRYTLRDEAGNPTTYTSEAIAKLAVSKVPNAPVLGWTLDDAGSISDNTPNLEFSLSDPDSDNLLRYQVQIDNNADFSSPEVDFTEIGAGAITPRNNVTFTSPNLTDGDWYWRVKTLDNFTLASGWSEASNGFRVDTVLPVSTILYPQDKANLKDVKRIIGQSLDSANIVNYTRISIYNQTTGQYYNGSSFVSNTEEWLMTNGVEWTLSRWYYDAPVWEHLNTYIIRSRAMDIAENEEHTDSITFTYDTVNGKEWSIYVDNPAYMNNSNYTIYYPNTVELPTNGYIEIDFSSEYSLSSWISDGDVSISDTGNGITASTDSFDLENEIIRSTITAGSIAADSLVTLSVNNLRIHNPSASGSYVISINLYNSSDVFLESGSGTITIVEPYQQVELNIAVQQSLQLSVDSGSVLLSVDPDVQLGQNWVWIDGVVSEKTDVTVKTNAISGYNLMISLAGNTATGSAVLDGTTETGNTITSSNGDRVSTENNFSFSTNSGSNATGTAFNNSSTQVSGVGASAPTNSFVDEIFYFLNIDYITPSDTYQGTVTYTAVGQF